MGLVQLVQLVQLVDWAAAGAQGGVPVRPQALRAQWAMLWAHSTRQAARA